MLGVSSTKILPSQIRFFRPDPLSNPVFLLESNRLEFTPSIQDKAVSLPLPKTLFFITACDSPSFSQHPYFSTFTCWDFLGYG